MILHEHKFMVIALTAFLIMLLGISVPELGILSGILLCTMLVLIVEYLRKETVSDLQV